MVSLPSATAIPTAVNVKLLLSENIMCGSAAAYGAHQPSDYVSVPNDHHAVQRVDGRFSLLHKSEDGCRRDALPETSAER